MTPFLAQLAYWTRGTGNTGRPRATRAKVSRGKWWVVLGCGTIAKRTPPSLGHARRASRDRRRLGAIEAISAKDAGVVSEAGGIDFGPNTPSLRVNNEMLDPNLLVVAGGL